MDEKNRLLKCRKQISAHVVRDDSVLQAKHVQGGDMEGKVVEYLVLLACTAETGYNNGEAEVEVWLQSTLLERAQHGHESSSLAEAQDAVKGTLLLDRSSHGCHALIKAQAFFTLLQGIESLCLDIRKPPSPEGLITSSTRSGRLLRSF